MNCPRFATLLFLLLLAPSAHGIDLEDVVRRKLAAPAVIVEHADDLRLSLAQRDDLIDLGVRYQADVRRLEADILEASSRMGELIEQGDAAHDAVLAELDRINAAEARIKRLHLDLWLRANASLNTTQQRRAIEWSEQARQKELEAERRQCEAPSP